MSANYLKKHGKLTEQLNLPIDEQMAERVKRIKQKTEFNKYLRDRLEDLVCDLEKTVTYIDGKSA